MSEGLSLGRPATLERGDPAGLGAPDSRPAGGEAAHGDGAGRPGWSVAIRWGWERRTPVRQAGKPRMVMGAATLERGDPGWGWERRTPGRQAAKPPMVRGRLATLERGDPGRGWGAAGHAGAWRSRVG